jgi:hypothetical protein
MFAYYSWIKLYNFSKKNLIVKIFYLCKIFPMIERGCPNSRNLQKELLPSKTDIFIKNYIADISSPLTLQNHVGLVTFKSGHFEVANRKQALSDYFSRHGRKDHISLGRSIFAEIVSAKMLNSIFDKDLYQQDMKFSLVPTDFDKSSNQDEIPYQKGADICLAKKICYENKDYLLPICGLDVTLGENDIVKKKRQKPGLQTKVAIPIITLPLREIAYKDCKNDFNDYLDMHARAAVNNYGDYQAFYGLDGAEKRGWRHRLLDSIIYGSRICRKKLMQNDDPRTSGFPYFPHVNRQLDFLEKLVKRNT